LRLQGRLDAQEGTFLVGIGKAAQAKHQFRAGDIVSGRSMPVDDTRLEIAEYYKTASKLFSAHRPSNPHHHPGMA
jgi:hypothetical protein